MDFDRPSAPPVNCPEFGQSSANNFVESQELLKHFNHLHDIILAWDWFWVKFKVKFSYSIRKFGAQKSIAMPKIDLCEDFI
jgi:hypothetical protein